MGEAAYPRTCLLTVTNRCVLRCKMCRLWKLDTGDREISIDECRRLVDQACELSPGGMEFHLIGGESLIKPGLFGLIRYIKDKGARSVITSCGYTIDAAAAHELAGSGLSMLNISLDSLDPAVHNFLRGRDDCFERVMKAIEHLAAEKKPGFTLGINTVISAVNLGSLEPLVRWVQKHPALDSIYFMAVMRPFGSDLGWDWYEKEECKFLWPAPEKAAAAIDRLTQLKKDGKLENPAKQLEDFKSYFRDPREFIKARRCNLRYQALNVNAVGDAYMCFFMDKLGNAAELDLRRDWLSEKAEKIREKMAVCRQNCELVVNCYYGD
jgi:MoaA/NifB/PqqE/SkfB family radical SAM enzyme